MIKKHFIIISMIAIVCIFQNNFCMELEGPEKSKAPHSKIEESNRPLKQQKICEEEKIYSTGEVTKDSEEFRPFDKLPNELHFLIFENELRNIIQHNSIFTPLDGAKEYLDTLAAVCKQFNMIAKDLGWNNCLSGENQEPKYRLIVKMWFVPEVIYERDSNSLDEDFKIIIRGMDVKLKNLRDLPLIPSNDDRNSNQGFIDNCQRWRNTVMTDIDNSRKLMAQCLIAGVNPNLINITKDKLLVNGPLIIIFVNNSELNQLVQLLIMKKVDIRYKDSAGLTALAHAVDNPIILKQLLDYDKSGINDVSKYGLSILDEAVSSYNAESVELLLKNGARDVDRALEMIFIHYNDDNDPGDEDPIDNYLADVKIAELLIQHGADITKLPKYTKHPLITRGWLITTQNVQKLKKQIESENKHN